jgi:hypothetical protein
MKQDRLSPRSGLMRIVQRFIAGNAGPYSRSQSAKRTTEIHSPMNSFGIFLSPVSPALILLLLFLPTTKVPGYFRDVRSADDNRIVAVLAVQNDQTKPDELKVLEEGYHSAITHSFVAVVRDADAYAKLRKLDGNLPTLDADFFESNVVIAAFLGERNTGGYAVEITREGSGQIHVAEKKPGKGVMVPQMITSPFKIVALEGSPSSTVALSLDDTWRQRTQSYRVTKGTLAFSGGFAGTRETFELRGRVLVMREGTLATLNFDLFSSGLRQMRSLTDSATTVVAKDGRIAIGRMGAGSLVPPPNGGQQAIGMFSDQGKKLLLEFSPRAINVADSYGGRGSIEAELSGAADKP